MKQRKYVLERLISKFYANTTTDYQKSVLVTYKKSSRYMGDSARNCKIEVTRLIVELLKGV